MTDNYDDDVQAKRLKTEYSPLKIANDTRMQAFLQGVVSAHIGIKEPHLIRELANRFYAESYQAAGNHPSDHAIYYSDTTFLSAIAQGVVIACQEYMHAVQTENALDSNRGRESR